MKKKKKTLISTCLIPLPDSSNCVTHCISTMKSKGYANKPEVLGKKILPQSNERSGEDVFLPFNKFSWHQIRSVAQSCPTLCDPMNRSTPGLPVHHQLPEFTQTYVHRVSDAIQPSHPLSSPSPPAPNPSQHQSLFQ